MSASVLSPQIGGKFPYKLAAVAVLHGEIALINASGFATYGQITTGMIAKGVFEDSVDNSGGSAGDKSVAIQTGWDAEGGKILLPMKNASGGDAVDQADVGRSVYVFDKNTVSGTSNGNTRVRAGKFEGFTRDGLCLVHFDGDQDADDIAPLQDQVDDIQVIVDASIPATKREVSVVFGDLSAGSSNGASVSINIGAVLPANARILSYNVELTTPFTGGSASAVTIDIGTSGDADAIADGVDVFAAAVDGNASSAPAGIAPFKHFTAGGAQLLAKFTPDGGHKLSELTAGACKVTVLYTVLA